MMTKYIGGTNSGKYNKRYFKRFMLVKFGINLYKNMTPIPDRYLEIASRYNLNNDGLGLDACPFRHFRRQQAGLGRQTVGLIVQGGDQIDGRREQEDGDGDAGRHPRDHRLQSPPISAIRCRRRKDHDPNGILYFCLGKVLGRKRHGGPTSQKGQSELQKSGLAIAGVPD